MADDRQGSVGVIGAGMMGASIALSSGLAGRPTILHDSNEGTADAAIIRLRAITRQMVERGRLTADAAAATAENLTAAKQIGDLSGCRLVIEAVYEDLAIKRSVFQAAERVVARDALLATNTSTLSVSEIARDLEVPGRTIGMHFFVPAHVNKLVEIAVPKVAAAETLAAAVHYCEIFGKQALICRDTPGFVVNRFYLPLINEAARCVDEGLGSPDEIESAACAAFNLAIGPFAVCNMGKPKTTLAAIEGLGSLGTFYAPARSFVAHAQADTPWPLSKNSKQATPQQAPIDRLRSAVFYPVLHALGDGVAKPADFDQGAAIALRFGLPPAALMNSLGRDAVAALVTPICTRYGAALPSALDQIERAAVPSAVHG